MNNYYEDNIVRLDNAEAKLIGLMKSEDKLFRQNFGGTEVKNFIEPVAEEIRKRLGLVRQYAKLLPPMPVSNLVSRAEQQMNTAGKLLAMKDSQYASEYSEIIKEMKGDMFGFDEKWLELKALIIATHDVTFIGDAKLLVDSQMRAFKGEVEQIRIDLQNKEQSLLTTIEKKFKDGQQRLDEHIVEREADLKKKAREVSMEDAIDQFKKAKTSHCWKSMGWGVFSLGLIVLLLILLHDWLIDTPKEIIPPATLPLNYNSILIYKSIMHFLIIGVFGGMITFSLRNLRANLHMMEHNAHRLRMVTSLQVLINAPHDNSQADLIIVHLVQTIAEFGNSGLLNEKDDSIIPSKISLESIVKNLPGKPG